LISCCTRLPKGPWKWVIELGSACDRFSRRECKGTGSSIGNGVKLLEDDSKAEEEEDDAAVVVPVPVGALLAGSIELPEAILFRG